MRGRAPAIGGRASRWIAMGAPGQDGRDRQQDDTPVQMRDRSPHTGMVGLPSRCWAGRIPRAGSCSSERNYPLLIRPAWRGRQARQAQAPPFLPLARDRHVVAGFGFEHVRVVPVDGDVLDEAEGVVHSPVMYRVNGVVRNIGPAPDLLRPLRARQLGRIIRATKIGSERWSPCAHARRSTH